MGGGWWVCKPILVIGFARAKPQADQLGGEGGEGCLNSKSEFKRCHIPRLKLEGGRPEGARDKMVGGKNKLGAGNEGTGIGGEENQEKGAEDKGIQYRYRLTTPPTQ